MNLLSTTSRKNVDLNVTSFTKLTVLGYTKVVTRGSGGTADSYSCELCSNIKTSSGATVTGFDCNAGTNIGQPICGANSIPEKTGTDWICGCEAGFILNSAGTCVACSVVVTAEVGTGASSQSKLFQAGKYTLY